MKKFNIITGFGTLNEISAENKQGVLEKLSTRHYKIVPVRGQAKDAIVITPDLVIKIEEVD